HGKQQMKAEMITLQDPGWLIPAYPFIRACYEQGKPALEVEIEMHLHLAGKIREEHEQAFVAMKWISETMVEMCYDAWDRGENPSAEELATRAIKEIMAMASWIEEMKLPD